MLTNLKNQYFQRLLKRKHLPDVLPLGDIPAEAEEEPEPRDEILDEAALDEYIIGALEAGVATPPAAPPHVPPLHVELPLMPPVLSRVAAVPGARINFDNYSHQSGNRRALTTCGRPGHGRCRLDVFLKGHEDAMGAAVFLPAWHVGGADFETGIEHMAYRPTD